MKTVRFQNLRQLAKKVVPLKSNTFAWLSKYKTKWRKNADFLLRDHGPDVIRKRNMLTVTTEQEKALYLRAFTAGVLNHTYGGWDVLPDSAYSGEYAGLLDWLDSKGFDPFTQVAQYYALGDAAPEANTVTVQVKNANRAYWNAPATLTDTGRAREWQDSCLETSGFFGKRSYTMTEVSDAREERALSSFLWKLIRSRPKHTLLQNLKRRYRSI